MDFKTISIVTQTFADSVHIIIMYTIRITYIIYLSNTTHTIIALLTTKQ